MQEEYIYYDYLKTLKIIIKLIKHFRHSPEAIAAPQRWPDALLGGWVRLLFRQKNEIHKWFE